MLRTLRLLIIGLFIPSVVWGATLLDIDWDQTPNTGCTSAEIRDGTVLDAPSGGLCTIWNVAYDATLGKYYLNVTDSSGPTYSINGGSSTGSPATMYIRFWVRFHKWGGQSLHPIWMNENKGGGHGACVLRSYPYGFGFMQSYSPDDMWDDYSPCYNRSWNYTGTSPVIGQLQLETWYRIEYKFAGVNTTTGTITVKIDGTDVSYYCMGADSGGCRLTQRDGTLTIAPMNYIYFSIYDAAGGQYFDLAGFKVTDDDWIGADDAPPETPKTLNRGGCLGGSFH